MSNDNVENQALDALLTGQAWSDFCDDLKEAGQDLLREGAPKNELDIAEGHRYLTHALRSAFELILEAGNPQDPGLRVSLGAGIKLGWDNPDNVHHNASLRGKYSYRLSGTRGDAHYFSIAVYAGSYSKGGSRTIAFIEADELDAADDGSFEVVLSPHEHPGNWIRLEEDTSSMMLRQIFSDRSKEKPADLKLERIDEPAQSRPLRAVDVTSGLKRVVGMIRGTNQIIFGWSDKFKERPNELLSGDAAENESLQGIADQTLAGGWWEISPEQAIVIQFTRPQCHYWSFVLSNYWGQSLDYERHQTYINDRNVRYAEDGSITLVIAQKDPGIPHTNWIDTAAHESGIWQFRWLKANDVDIPTARVVAWEKIAEAVKPSN